MPFLCLKESLQLEQSSTVTHIPKTALLQSTYSLCFHRAGIKAEHHVSDNAYTGQAFLQTDLKTFANEQ